jgi:hypothetical protein
MSRRKNELLLQHYLLKRNGENLRQINPHLRLLDYEHKFPGGRIDILAQQGSSKVALELKARQYSTNSICAQLLNYLNYLRSSSGKVYFIAPKIKYGVYSTLKEFYEGHILELYEVQKNSTGDKYFFQKMSPGQLDDRRRIQYLDEELSANEQLEEKIKQYLEIIIKDKKEAKLIKSILDNKKLDDKHLNEIIKNILPCLDKNPGGTYLHQIYSLAKLL